MNPQLIYIYIYTYISSKDVWCHETVKAPDDVMVGAVGSPRFEVEQWRPRWRIAVDGPKLGR